MGRSNIYFTFPIKSISEFSKYVESSLIENNTEKLLTIFC